MSVRLWCYRASWLAQGCLPLLRPFALLLASCGGVPSGSASGSASSLRDGVTLPGRACLNPRSERRLFLHLSGFGWSLRDGVTLLCRFCLRARSERRLFAHLPLRSRRDRSLSSDRYRSRLSRSRSWGDRSRSSDQCRDRSRRDRSRPSGCSRLRRQRAHSPAHREVVVTGCGYTIPPPPPPPPVALVTARGHVVGDLFPLPACGLSGQDERYGIRRLLSFIYPSLLRDGVTLWVVCVFSHSIVTKSPLGS